MPPVATRWAASKTPLRRLAIIGLGLVFVLGAYARLYDIGEKSISHPEMYVPNIRMPEALSEPRQRLTLTQVLTGTFSSDTHPPGYYILMYGWTKVFGTGLFAIRFPSVLLGIASIALLIWLGHLAGERRAAWVAGALLALNGLHVRWSQIARMYSLACFLGLLATVLLLLLAQGRGPRRLLGALYVLVILAGLGTNVYFWPLFLTHMVWSFLSAAREKAPLPAVCRVQILALILGSFFLASAAYQSGNTVAILSKDVLLHARQYVAFCHLFPVFDLEREPGAASQLQGILDALLPAARVITVLLGVALLIVAARIREASPAAWTGLPGGPSTRGWLGAALLTIVAIQGFILVALRYVKPQPPPTWKLSQALIVLPPLIAVSGVVCERYWAKISEWMRPHAQRNWLASSRSVIWLLALFPFGILAAFALLKPILIARGLVVFAPYLLLLLALGLVRLASTQRLVGGAIVVVLLALHAGSLLLYTPALSGEVDFGQFSRALIPELQPDDTIVLRKNWAVTPILYYLKADQHRLVEFAKLEKTLRDPATQRVWLVLLYRDDLTESAKSALTEFGPVKTVETKRARALCYARKSRG